MNNRRGMAYLIILIWLTLWSCSQPHSLSKAVWTAQPEFIKVDNQLFEARFTPQKGEYPYFAYFHLTLLNKGDEDLIVDWNHSRYLFNGKPQGVMVFEGIDPERIKAATVPTETVAPGEVLTRDLMPFRLIAWVPVRDKSPNTPGIRPGILPAGQNGIRLAVQHAGGRMTIPLSVRILAAK